MVLDGTFQQVQVIDADGEPHPEDGTDHRGNQHRTDDGGRGIDVQPQGGDEDGENKHPQTDPTENSVLADLFNGFLFTLLVRQGIEIAFDD